METTKNRSSVSIQDACFFCGKGVKMGKSAKEMIDTSRREFVEQLLSQMEQGVKPWKSLWDVGISRPHNPVTGSVYRAGNYLKLMWVSKEMGYEDSRWMTFQQAKEKGYSIKKGEKSVLLEKWISTKKVKEKNEQGEIEEKIVPRSKPYVNYFRVFNAEQIDGIGPAPKVIPMERDEMLLTAEQFMQSSACEIVESDQDGAYYMPQKDKIYLPLRDYFKNQEAFLSVVLHEMAHSTGHETRLNRPLMNTFGTEDYAKEELNAELSSAFIQADLGIHLEGEVMQDHAAYLQSWIQVLRNDPDELFRAASRAEKISEYLVERFEQQLLREREWIVNQDQERDNNINNISSDQLSTKGNALLRMALKCSLRAGTLEAGVLHLQNHAEKFPEDVEGNQLVQKIFMKKIKEFSNISFDSENIDHEKEEDDFIRDEAREYGYSVEEFESKCLSEMPKLKVSTKRYDMDCLIQELARSLSGEFEIEESMEIEME